MLSRHSCAAAEARAVIQIILRNMPLYRIGEAESEYLAHNVPETAMGFQILKGDFFTFEGNTFIVFGSKLVLPFLSQIDLAQELNRLSDVSWQTALERTQEISFSTPPQEVEAQLNIRLVSSLLDHSISTTKLADRVYSRQQVVGREEISEPRLYFRFSAFPNDKRVKPDGSWTPGTYATTYNDVRMVPSGYAAVGRYALPNPRSAMYVFPLLTDASPVRIGTVTPNFGQAGGGVEVYFPSGASPVPGVSHRIEIA